jgi:alkylation response protein AidB-like acyl-CoA dehydrogenase
MTLASDTGLTKAAEDVRAAAAAHAAEAEIARRLSPEVIDAVRRAGFARHFVPLRLDGHDGGFAELLAATAVVGEGCASAAWCAALYATLGRMAVHLPTEGQDEVWAAGPDTLVVGAITPSGRAAPVGDGWRLSGTWPFTSAAGYADWVLAASVVPDVGLRYFAVPRAEYTVLDTWHNVGMRGTGSDDIVLDDVHVPAHRSFAGENLWQGRGNSPEQRHNVPFKAVNGLSFVAPALGAARAALDHWVTILATKNEITGRATRDRVSAQLTVARAGAEIDAAHLLLERAADVADRAPVPPDLLVRNSRDFAVAVDLLVTATERVFRAGGARGQRDSDVVQRAWRDVTCAAGHVALQFEANGGAYAQHVLATRSA